MISTDVLDPFRKICHRNSDINPNPNENIQRIEITSMDEHFNKLKYSDVTFDFTFYNDLTKVVGQKYFVVKGFFNMDF